MLKVERVVAAFGCGRAANPLGLRPFRFFRRLAAAGRPGALRRAPAGPEDGLRQEWRQWALKMAHFLECAPRSGQVTVAKLTGEASIGENTMAKHRTYSIEFKR